MLEEAQSEADTSLNVELDEDLKQVFDKEAGKSLQAQSLVLQAQIIRNLNTILGKLQPAKEKPVGSDRDYEG